MSSKSILTAIVVLALVAGTAWSSGSGTVDFAGSGSVTANVWEGAHSQHYLNVIGNDLGGTYNWSTDVWPGRGTALVGNVNVQSGGDASAYFSNYVDFSATTGSARAGSQATEIWGNQISMTQTAGRHQGYAMTETINLSVAGPQSGGMYGISNNTLLTDSAGTLASHSIGVWGTGSASMSNVGWASAAVRDQGITFKSDGGWGPTGQPNVNATGEGEFSQSVYGSTYTRLGTLGGSYMTLPGGGTAYQGAVFNNGFSIANMDARANNGGI